MDQILKVYQGGLVQCGKYFSIKTSDERKSCCITNNCVGCATAFCNVLGILLFII